MIRLVVILALLTSCGKPPSPTPSPTPSSIRQPKEFGVVTGVVTVAKGVDIAPIMGKPCDFAGSCHGAEFDLGIYKVDPATRGLADAFVEIVDGPDDFKSDGAQILDQKSCVFSPPVLVVAPGELLVRNSDSMPHNTSIEARINSTVNINLPAGQAQTVRLPFAEKLVVRCSIHPWMTSAVIVTRNPLHALTDSKGRFRIEGVPTGRHALRIWHQLGEETTREIEVVTAGFDLGTEWRPRRNP